MKYFMLVLVIACSFCLPVHAQQQEVVCSTVPTPSGWSIVNYQTSFSSCGNTVNDQKVIENLSTLGSQDSVYICNLPGNIPGGWLVSNLITEPLECGDTNGALNNVVEIFNANGLGTGTSLYVCNVPGNIPSGWVISNLVTNTQYCGDTNLAPNNIVEIFNANGYGAGATLNVCNFVGNVPTGWEVIGEFTNPLYCGDPSTLNNLITIQRL